jgi:hypothetical protein
MPDYPPLSQLAPKTFGTSSFGDWLANMMYRGFTAPGKALASTTPMTSEQMIAPAQDMMALMAGGGVPAAERGAVGAFGGRLASTSGDELVSNLTRVPDAAANEVTPFMRESPGSYQGAARQQQIGKAVGPDAHVGDVDYWRNLATKENITAGPWTDRPSFPTAARKYSEGGRTTMVIHANGVRHVYHDGEKVVGERMQDYETYPALKNLPRVPYTGQKLGEIVNLPIKPDE